MMKINRLCFLLTSILLGINAYQVKAQQAGAKVIFTKKTKDGRINFIKFSNEVLGNAAYKNNQQNVQRILGLSESNALKISERFSPDFPNTPDNNGFEHTRYNQSFKGLTVEYGVVTTHCRSGFIQMVSGDYYPLKENFSIVAGLDETTAFNFAIQHIGALKYSWEDSNFNHPNFKPKPKGELVICKNFNDSIGIMQGILSMRLAYKFKIYATKPLLYDCIYVDAINGNILHQNPIIKTTGGPADTRYSGRKEIVATYEPNSNLFMLKDSGNQYNLETYNLKTGTDYLRSKAFGDSDNVWTSNEYDNYAKDNAALDVHWATMMTLDYWRTAHGRRSYDNNGTKIKSYVHYNYYYANAFWDGTEMTYGDGDNTEYMPLTTLDICGHEIGHGVCEKTANLIYAGESGALNESLSDIWGTCVEQFAAPEKNTWLLGDECSITHTPLRSMMNPKDYQQPDTYHGQNWYYTGGFDHGGVHFNSGVMNFWFYLLSIGKDGANDNGFHYNILPIGINKAAKIAYRAEQIYLSPESNYSDARIFTIQAAEDLYGINSTEATITTAAWDAVGVYDFAKVPDSLVASFDSSGGVHLNWFFDPSQPVLGFSIEKALDSSDTFIPIANVNGNIRRYLDASFDTLTINKYRIRAFQGSPVTYSFYSNTAQISSPKAPYFVFQKGTFTTCGTILTDPGGFENYPNKYYNYTVLKPAAPKNKLRLQFTKFDLKLSWDNWGWDYFRVYNGPSDSTGKFLGYYYGNQLPPLIQSSAPLGDLLIDFYSDNGDNAPGWEAIVSCYKPLYQPLNLNAAIDNISTHPVLSWIDNSDDETKFVLERSVNDSLHFALLADIPANTVTYTDAAATNNTINFYRIKSVRDTTVSAFADTAKIIIGNPYSIIQNGTVTSCSLVLLDPGGLGNYDTTAVYTTTFVPGIAGRKIKFSISSVANNYYDYLTFYNGPNTSGTFLGVFTSLNQLKEFTSTAPNGEITVRFTANSNTIGGAKGWEAVLSCYKPVTKPTNLTGTINANNNVRISWNENADDETKMLLQRSVNSSSSFSTLLELVPNTNQYIDSTAPVNSLLNYRIVAFRNADSSLYSDTLQIAKGNAPVFMSNNIVTTCDKVFMDPGGAGVTKYNNNGTNAYTTTFSPAIAGNRIRVNFSYFSLNYGSGLAAYAGTSTNAPRIGSYSSYIPPTFIDGIGPDGAVTFSYYNQYNSDSGWIAHVTCYKPVAKPAPLTAVLDANNKARLSWNDNTNDETKYVVERSVNAPNNFFLLAQLASNSTAYIDYATPANSITYYRVIAYRDTIGSFYSDTAKVTAGNYPFLIKDSTVIACDRDFMDQGGLGMSLSTSSNITCTFKPAIAGNKIRVTFSQMSFNGYLYVYDGLNTSGSPMYYLNSYTHLPLVVEATNSSGALTFSYYSSNTDSGWIAHVSCIKPIPRPTNVRALQNANNSVTVNWLDNAADESSYTLERSKNGVTHFLPIAQLPANSTTYTDATAPNNNVLYYRVFAKRDSIVSYYSDTAKLNAGTIPFLMKDTTLVTCNRVFMSPGGEDMVTYYNASTYTTTFKPAIPGNSIRVVFQKFDVRSGLSVVNGTSYTYVGSSYYDNSHLPPPVLDATGADGALTFRYYTSTYDTGWIAAVTCFLPVTAPTNLLTTLAGFQSPQLRWTDNSGDETGFIIERSTGDSLHFTLLTLVNANTTNFIDNTAPNNTNLFYRVRAYRDAEKSLYSNLSYVSTGYPVLVMSNGTFATCDMLFYDNGGSANNYSNNSNYYLTLKPAHAGDKLKISFNKFRTEKNWDYLIVYDGPSYNSTRVGYFTGSDLPPSIQSTASNGELTFEFYADEAITDIGWDANVFCVTGYKTISWTGVVSSEWENPLNWSVSQVPDGQTTAIINSNVPHFPVIHSNAICNKLDIKPGASVNVDPGFHLTILK